MAPLKRRLFSTLKRRLRTARRELRRLRRACESLAVEKQEQELEYYRWLLPQAPFKEEGGIDFEAFARQQEEQEEA